MADLSDIFRRPEPQMVSPRDALPGRAAPLLAHPGLNAVLHTPLAGPWPDGTRHIFLAMGCFWGVEKLWWQTPGVVGTAVGYMGGYTPNPTYEEVCTGRTGHAETVHVVYDPAVLTDAELFRRFWEAHDPTQGYRQGADVGTQYRSAIFWTTAAQHAAAERTGDVFAARLKEAGYGAITTELAPADVPPPRGAGPFYLAEEYHQQYLLKNPHGYCPVHATGIACR